LAEGKRKLNITLTFVTRRYLREILKYLTGVRGYEVTESLSGIYTVKGDYLPIQIIETKKLSEDENLWLKSLTNDLESSAAKTILEVGKKVIRGADASATRWLTEFAASRRLAYRLPPGPRLGGSVKANGFGA
jgi:hypothetical protein